MAAVLIEHTGRVMRVVLDRPPLNVIDLAAAHELVEALESVRRQPALSAVVLAARGSAFCAGVDVRDHLPDRGAEMIRTFDRACALLLEIEAPVVAAVQGAALGGGAELALVCDIVLAAESAVFGFPEIKLGVFPPIAVVALSGVVSAQRAAELVLTGRVAPAAEAERMGLANWVIPDAEFQAAVGDLVAQLAALSPEALRVAKRALRLGRARPDAGAIAAAERIYLEERLEAPDAIEGLNAFIEKRAPDWSKP
jgi:cyclohexa-1,5-dienecarbonyl-CoA hydratase